MVLLSPAGWSPPCIAPPLTCFPPTVRHLLHDFQRRGPDALFPAQAGPPPDTTRRRRILDRLRAWRSEDRTGTSAPLAKALGQEDTPWSGRQVRRSLKLLNMASTLQHKQDPAQVERAAQTLRSLNKKRRPAA